jgi:hypothetical protein
MKTNNKNSNLHRETGFAGHFAELRGFGATRRGAGRRRALAESHDYAAVAAAGAVRTTLSENASLK